MLKCQKMNAYRGIFQCFYIFKNTFLPLDWSKKSRCCIFVV